MPKRMLRLFHNKLLLSLIAVFSTAVLIYLSLNTSSGGSPLFPHQDKWLHIISYGYITGLYFWTFDRGYRLKKALLKAAGAAFSLGVLLECLQPLPFFNRTFDPMDLLMNSLGIFLAGFVCEKIKK